MSEAIVTDVLNVEPDLQKALAQNVITSDEHDKIVLGIPPEALPALEKHIQRLRRRATRLGITQPTIKVLHEEPWIQEMRETSKGPQPRWIPVGKAQSPVRLDTPARMVALVEIAAPLPKLKGWRVGLIINYPDELSKPSQVWAMKGFEQRRKEYLAAEHDHTCEYCHTQRERKLLFLLQHENGATMQVGSTCIHEFTQTDKSSVAGWISFWSLWAETPRAFLDSVWSQGSDYVPRVYFLRHILAVAAALTREHGWVSRQDAGRDATKVATSDRVREYCLTASAEYRDSVLPGGVTEDDLKTADLAIETLTALKERPPLKLSDYELNLRNLDNTISERQFGIAASLVRYTQNQIEHNARMVERNNAQGGELSKSEWFGSLKNREVLDVTLQEIREVARKAPVGFNDFGRGGDVFYIHTFREARGDAVWISSNSLPQELVGKKLKIKATIVKFSNFRGRKQTNINRVTVLEQELDEPQNGATVPDAASVAVR